MEKKLSYTLFSKFHEEIEDLIRQNKSYQQTYSTWLNIAMAICCVTIS